jgi:uncharacterized protein (DUF58 family)
MPARRVFVGLALLSLLLVASLTQPALAWAALALDVLLALALLLDLARARREPLAAERRWPPLLVQGTAAQVTVIFTRRASRALVLQAREALHPAVAESPRRTSLRLAPAGATEWSYPLEPRRRGEHRIGPLTVRVLGPWGLAWSQRTLLPPEPRRVYPQIRWEGALGQLLMLAHRRQLGQAPLRIKGQGREAYALRDYRPGDSPQSIHWKASARHDRLIAREETWERGARLLVLLDGARAMASMDGRRSKLDHALAAALALARIALSRGDRVTVVGFSDRIERVTRMRSGRSGASQAYAALYDLEARLTEPAYDVAIEKALQLETRQATLVLLTSVVDLASAELLRESLLRLRRRHRALLVNLQDPELVGLALGRPRSIPEAFAKVSCLELLMDNRRLGRQLGRAGVRVVSPRADRLAWETIEGYLAIAGAAQRAWSPPRPSS